LLLGDCQSQASATFLVVRFTALEGLEDFRLGFRGNADAGVDNLKREK